MHHDTALLWEKQIRLLSARQMFDVELTTACNKHCYICPRDKLIRPRAMMTQAQFEALCHWLPADCDVFFAGFGEPLLHNSCVDFVRRLHDSGRGTSIMTNGKILTREKADELFIAGLDKLQISIISTTDLSLISCFELLISDQYKNRVVFNIIKESAVEDPQAELNEMRRNGWRFCIKQIHNRAGALYPADYMEELKTCGTFFCDTFIDAAGEIHVCSNDINGCNNIGNIKEVSFQNLIDLKRKFLGNKQICPLCASCVDEYRLKHFEEV